MASQKFIYTIILFIIPYFLVANQNGIALDTISEDTVSLEEMMVEYQFFIDSINNSFEYTEGEVEIGSGLAKIKIPETFKYINGEDADRVLTELWGNPASDFRSLGMLFPENTGPMSDSSYAINITYTEDGYVNDEDAADIDYDDLLKSMKADVIESNKYRRENGYEEVKLIGWASDPYYDQQEKKLHWAKELQFGDIDENTLNYNIRVLGRKGYLEMNVIGGMYVLDEVKNNIGRILPSIEFLEGNRYSDFDPSIDKVAAYGIAGLIAGKIALKAGILAKLGIILAKFWKLIMVALVAVGAGFKKFFSGKKEERPPV